MISAIYNAIRGRAKAPGPRQCLRLALPFSLGVVLLCHVGDTLATSLENINFTALPGDRVQIELQMSDPLAAAPLSFTIDNPARVALDFPGVSLKVPRKNQSIGIGKVESVSAVEAGERTRVVVNLVQSVPYSVKADGNSVKIMLEGIPADTNSTTAKSDLVTKSQAPKPASAGITMPGTAQGEQIKAIDFRRGAQGEAQIVVDLSNPGIGINIQQEGADQE